MAEIRGFIVTLSKLCMDCMCMWVFSLSSLRDEIAFMSQNFVSPLVKFKGLCDVCGYMQWHSSCFFDIRIISINVLEYTSLNFLTFFFIFWTSIYGIVYSTCVHSTACVWFTYWMSFIIFIKTNVAVLRSYCFLLI